MSAGRELVRFLEEAGSKFGELGAEDWQACCDAWVEVWEARLLELAADGSVTVVAGETLTAG